MSNQVELKNFILSLSADDVGFCKHNNLAPFNQNLPYAITIMVKLPTAVLKTIDGKPTINYFHAYRTANALLDEIAFKKDLLIASLELEKSDLVREKAELEEKLAEKESEVKVGEFWHSAYQGKQLDYDKVYAELRQLYDENEKLKQQLAEKEKSFEWLHNKYAKHIETCNQDKISFSVEQLEKVKEWINNNLEENYGLNGSLFYVVNSSKMSEEIDNQIKQLKEWK